MSPRHAALYLAVGGWGGGRGLSALIRAWVTDCEFSSGAGRLRSVYQLAEQLSVILHRDLGGVLLASAPILLKIIIIIITRQVQLRQPFGNQRGEK